MLNIDELMRKATYEQRTVLSRLKGLVAEEKKLIEETKRSYDQGNFRRGMYRLPEDRDPPMTDKLAREHLSSNYSSSGRRFREIEGKIKRVVQDVTRTGMLVVPCDSLK